MAKQEASVEELVGMIARGGLQFAKNLITFISPASHS